MEGGREANQLAYREEPTGQVRSTRGSKGGMGVGMEIKIILRMWKGQNMETPANAKQWALGAARQWAED